MASDSYGGCCLDMHGSEGASRICGVGLAVALVIYGYLLPTTNIVSGTIAITTVLNLPILIKCI